jgi:hypothetical protein
MDVQKSAIDFAKTSGQFGAGVVGLGAGVFAMNQVPASVPAYVRGAAAMLLAYLAANTVGKNNDYIKSGAAGLGAAGFLDLAKALTTGKTGILATINSKLPSLSGVGHAPPAYIYGLRGPVERKLLSGVDPVKNLLVG